ncbi:MAG: hypothetical protein V1799_08065 [bacterium]
MLIGHIGAGIACKKIDPQINVSWLVLAALLPDMFLGVLTLIGIEGFIVPKDFLTGRYLLFTFPISHNLLANVLVALLLFLGIWKFTKGEQRIKRALAIAIAFQSHTLLDIIVHVKGLPLFGAGDWSVGLGLWEDVVFSMLIELLLLLFGLECYFRATKGEGIIANYAMIVVTYLLAAVAFYGQLQGPKPENIYGPALSWIFLPLILFLLFHWLDTKRSPRIPTGEQASV